ncbi:MAG: mercuric reductase [Gammaproteobacteria bacterium]|nr:mercuric reductase [Gammaproteobacteria bacterium]
MSYPGVDYDVAAWQLLSPADYVNPQPQPGYHLVVVGAGPAGLISAIGAAGLGAKVALVERHRMGGDCLNVGCMPSKSLLAFTEHAENPDFDQAFAWLRQVRAEIAPHDSVERYTAAGVDVFLGDGVFNESGHVCVGGAVLKGRRVAICTGARAAVPPIPGLRESDPLTNETVFDLREKPQSLAILGAGAIGCELAQAFARLGVRVELFDLADRVLPNENRLASVTLAQALAADGVSLHLGSAVQEVVGSGRIVTEQGSVECDRVLVALGRQPNTEGMNLSAASVQIDERGFIVSDAKLRTTNKKIFAAGDCTATLQFTHHADAQARALIQNALFLPTAKIDELVIPHCTYTRPEVASVGLSQEQLQASGTPYDEYEFYFDELDRTKAMQFPDDMARAAKGYVQVFTVQGKDKILGAAIVGADAGELLAPICLLMTQNLGLSAAQRTVFSYPTRSEYLKRLGDAYNRNRMTPAVARVFQRWLALIQPKR